MCQAFVRKGEGRNIFIFIRGGFYRLRWNFCEKYLFLFEVVLSFALELLWNNVLSLIVSGRKVFLNLPLLLFGTNVVFKKKEKKYCVEFSYWSLCICLLFCCWYTNKRGNGNWHFVRGRKRIVLCRCGLKNTRKDIGFLQMWSNFDVKYNWSVLFLTRKKYFKFTHSKIKYCFNCYF